MAGRLIFSDYQIEIEPQPSIARGSRERRGNPKNAWESRPVRRCHVGIPRIRTRSGSLRIGPRIAVVRGR